MGLGLVDDMLADVKVRANIPTSNGALTDAELLTLGNDELRGILTGRLMEPLQGYLLTEVSLATVAGQALYDLPQRAAGGRIAYAVMQDAAGKRRGLIEKGVGVLAASTRDRSANGRPVACYFQGMKLGVYPPSMDTSESLVIGYYLRPSAMCLTSAAGLVSGANAIGATSITITGGAGISGATRVDFVQGIEHFNITNMSLPVTSVTGTTCTLTAPGLLTAISAGDYVCVAGTSCMVQLPLEVQPLLTARWALRVMKARAPSSPDTQSLGQDVADLEASLFDFLGARNETQLETVAGSGLISRYSRGMGWGNTF